MIIQWIKKHITQLITALFILVISLVSLLALGAIKEQEEKKLYESLKTVLHTTLSGLDMWGTYAQAEISNFTQKPELLLLTRSLIEEHKQGQDLVSSPTQKLLRELMTPFIKKNGYNGFFIIGVDRKSLASMRNNNIGTQNLIDAHRKEYLDETFAGITRFIPTIQSDVPLNPLNKLMGRNDPTMFIAAPIIMDSGEILAVLTLRIDPTQNFTRIIQLGRYSKSGETYAIDSEGRLVSNSRFDDQLQQIRLIKPRDKSILNVIVRDPGKNLLTHNYTDSEKEQWPLTRMAQSLTQKESGFDMKGYRDYRGVEVCGVWLWDNDLGVGLVTEIDKDEAFGTFSQTLIILQIVLTIIVALAVVFFLLINKIKHKSQQALKRAHDELEDRVQLRTKELLQAQNELQILNRELEALSVTDSLTGLSNRRSFDSHLQKEWGRCHRYNKPITLVIFDIDDFKPFNDNYGHLAGDECLQKVGLFLLELKVAQRPGDIMARYGGEEFAVILSDADEEYGATVALSILDGISNLRISHGHHTDSQIDFVTVSVGLATFRDLRNKTIPQLIKTADEGLYRAKAEGKNTINQNIQSSII
ncbi:MAG: diguanylate cyclase [Fibrobacterales bacterium]